MVLTIPIFGAAMLVYGVQGWGPWAAVALLTCWAILAGTSAAQQAKLDGIEPVKPAPQAPWQRAAKAALFLIPIGAFARAQWLDHSGAPNEVAKVWLDGGWFALIICTAVTYAIDWIAFRIRSKS